MVRDQASLWATPSSFYFKYSYLRPLFFNSLIIFELEIGEGIKARTWVSSEHEKGSNQQH